MNNFYKSALALYTAFITKPVTRKTVQVPSKYVEITKMVANRVGWPLLEVEGYEDNFKVPPIKENKKVMLGFSSGLDSVYLMHKLIDEGYEVILCHVKGLNKSSACQEEKCARQIAKLNNLKLIIVPFEAPNQEFADNPFKNQLILSIMLTEGVKLGVYRYALGSDWTTPLNEGIVGFSITDTVEVNQAYWAGVKESLPQAELIFINDQDKKVQRVAYLYKNHFATFKNISSCVAPHRFREYWRNNNIKKYKIDLLKNRCGACYKCCMEYLLLCEQGLIPRNSQYYAHCWDILASSSTSHRPDLFSSNLPVKKRIENLMQYGS